MTAAVYDADTAARLRADAEEIIGRYPQPRSALLPMLHLVQSEDGYVSPRGIELCAQLLGLSNAEVSAVATFYSQYKRHPNGTYTVGVCTNTLCAVLGGDEIFARLADHLGVGHDETTDDGAVTLERIECNAACDYAPVMMVNWEFFDNVTPADAIDVVERLRAGEDVAPTRGAAKVCTFKEVSRVLAGFPDGRADEGLGAGHATLEGLQLARENEWHAPALPNQRRRRTSAAHPRTAAPKEQPAKAAGAAETTGEPETKAPERPARTGRARSVTGEGSPGPDHAVSDEASPEAAPRPARPRTTRTRRHTGEQAVGEPQSSAERKPETPADVDPGTTTAGQEDR